MKLVSCYIAGFGRLKDFSIEFSDGLTQVLADNGWGKTTFCAFIRAMFYGLEYKKSSNAKFYERPHYMPWDQGTYGGNLVFSVDNRVYRVERTFGKKESEDTFALFDHSLEKESNDYGERLGEQLFGVDKESFEKSIFFGQNLLATSITSSINAKMGDIGSAQDDIDQFDKAIKSIDDSRKIYTSTSKVNPGRLAVIKEKIRECRESAEHIPVLTQALIDRKKSLDEKQRQLRAMSVQREKFNTENQRLVAIKSSRDEIARLLPDEKEQRVLDNIFKDKVLSEEQISDWQRQAAEIKELRLRGEKSDMSAEDKSLLEELKEKFKDKIPSEEEISEIQSKAEKLVELEGQIAALEQQRQNTLEQIPDEKLRNNGEARRGRRILGILISALLFCGAILVYGMVSNVVVALVLAVIGLIVLIFVLFSRQQESREKKLHFKTSIDRQEKIDNDINQCYEDKTRIVEECEGFLNNYSEPVCESYLSAIANIRRNADRYIHLSEAEKSSLNDVSQNIELLTEKQMKLYTELLPYGNAYGYDLFEDHKEDELLQNLSKDYGVYLSYRESQTLLEQKNEQLKAQEKVLEQFGDIQSYRDLDERYDELQKTIVMEDSNISKQGNELEEEEEKARLLSSLIEQENAMKERVKLYEDTIVYLNQAREEFLSMFMLPLRQGMAKYLKSIHKDEGAAVNANDFVLDMDLSVKLRYHGSTKNNEYLSAGYKDLTALCARLTLVDVLYKDGVMPMLIMDDPFTNLDEDKIENGVRLIGDLAKNRQIIYFTCHESRTLSSAKIILP